MDKERLGLLRLAGRIGTGTSFLVGGCGCDDYFEDWARDDPNNPWSAIPLASNTIWRRGNWVLSVNRQTAVRPGRYS